MRITVHAYTDTVTIPYCTILEFLPSLVSSQDMVDVIRSLMPSGTFSEMLKMIKQVISFMSITVSVVGVFSHS